MTKRQSKPRKIDPVTAAWLCGQLDALAELAQTVAKTVRIHDADAAAELNEICYCVARAEASIEKRRK